MPGLASFLIENDGTIDARTIEHYRLRASGGVALVIMEACAVSQEGIVSPHQARIYDDRFIEGLSKIAQAIRSQGAVAGLQLHHGGRQTSSRIIKQKPVAPSNLPCPSIKGEVEPLSVDSLQRIISKFAEGAHRALEAGFEFLEIHGAHGYLINQFLSPFSNIRDDEYGGDLKGRAKFAIETIREIRRTVGYDIPLSFKISAQEFVPQGLDVTQSITILELLQKEGLDVVQVSAGNDATPEWISQPIYMKKACLADSAAQIKQALNLVVMSVGRINDPFVANEIIEKGKADLVCIGRGLLADPEFPNKARAGKFNEIRTCIACNTCMESIFRKGRIECLVNPFLGREKEIQIKPAANLKKVMVIGGGPGGMNAAWVSAQRGHRVSLFEKSNHLGGQLLLGSHSDYKQELRCLIDYHKHMIDKYGVKCVLNYKVDLDTIKDQKPDVIILANGSLPDLPQINGIENPIVENLAYILNGKKPATKETIIIGGGATGCEVAIHLAENGSPVHLIEQLPRLGTNIESVTKRVILKKLIENDVKTITGNRLLSIEPNGVMIVNDAGKTTFVKGERVLITTGKRPDQELYDKVQELGIEVYRIGDCLEPRNAKAAIYEAVKISSII
jgi:2,4-dienoyl-CoA reductase-like NADH-dependent reductase (Old Yellow Enzyme family)/thioredoxin reductase